MAQENKYNPHVGDIGTKLTVTLRKEDDSLLDLDDATTAEILLKPPKGSAMKTFTAVVVGADPDGRIRYTTAAASDLDRAGHWEIQGRVVKPGGEWRSEIGSFTVSRNIA